LLSGRLQQKYGIYKHETPKIEKHLKKIYTPKCREKTQSLKCRHNNSNEKKTDIG
jgi:ribosomal protein S30